MVVQKLRIKGSQYGKDKDTENKIYLKFQDRCCTGRVVTTTIEPVQVLKETPLNMHGRSIAEIEVKCHLLEKRKLQPRFRTLLPGSFIENYKPAFLPSTATICPK